MPPRTISATYAPLFIPNASTAVTILSTPSGKNIRKYIIISCTTIGVPRMTVRYTRHIALPIFSLPVFVCVAQIIATIKPRTIPIMTAKSVISSVLPRPSVRYFHRSFSIKLSLKSSQKPLHHSDRLCSTFCIYNITFLIYAPLRGAPLNARQGAALRRLLQCRAARGHYAGGAFIIWRGCIYPLSSEQCRRR